MKTLTLNKAWRLCLKQWKYMIKELDKASNLLDIIDLKNQWIKLNQKLLEQEGVADPMGDCFFCEYDDNLCETCPGKLVNRKFHCENKSYNYSHKPRKFYKKLLALNEKRKKK